MFSGTLKRGISVTCATLVGSGTRGVLTGSAFLTAELDGFEELDELGELEERGFELELEVEAVLFLFGLV